MTIECAICGKQKKRRAAHVRGVARPTCSYRCYGLLQRKRVHLTCDHCYKAYETHPSAAKWNAIRGRKYKFCSNSCRRGHLSGSRNPFWRGGVYIRNAKERHAFLERRRRAIKKGSGGTHTIEQWNELRRLCGYKCLCCRRPEPEISLTEDHIKPLVKGGSDDISNIQPLCRECNRYKWMQYIDFRPRDWKLHEAALKQELATYRV